MFTRNFDNLILKGVSGDTSTTTPTQTTWENGTQLGIKNNSGTYYPIYISSSIGSYSVYNILKITNSTNSFSTSYVTMVLGTGTAQETYNDYTINTASGLTMNSYTGTISIDTNTQNVIITNSKIVTNNTSSDITITEIGISKPVSYNSSGTVTPVLVYRKLLPTPVVIPANGGVQNFELKFTMSRPNMPSAS